MKRILPWTISIALAAVLIVTVGYLLMNNYIKQVTGETETQGAIQSVNTKKMSADEIVSVSSEIKEVKTNLAQQKFLVLMDFAFQLDQTKTKEAFDKIKEFKIRPIIIKTLADMGPEQLNGAKGKDEFCAVLLNLINEVLPTGKLMQIDITNYILTSI